MNEYTSKKSEIFLTPNQAAQILNLSLATVKKFIYTGRIKTIKTPGGHHRIKKTDLFALANSRARLSKTDCWDSREIMEILQGFVSFVEKRLSFGQGHARIVAEISRNIGLRLDFHTKQLNKLHFAALLHDIGMIGVSESILSKSTALTDQEYAEIKMHPLIGEKAVKTIGHLQELSPVVRQHHEWVNGDGYPDGLRKDDICQEARIISVAEAYACMRAQNSYKKTKTKAEALQEIVEHSDTQFDPQVVEALVASYA